MERVEVFGVVESDISTGNCRLVLVHLQVTLIAGFHQNLTEMVRTNAVIAFLLQKNRGGNWGRLYYFFSDFFCFLKNNLKP